MRHLNILLPLFAVMSVSMSCREDNGPYSDSFINYDIVIFESQTAEEGLSFKMYLPDSDTPIIYSDVRNSISLKNVSEGDRLLLGYMAEKGPYVSGPITVKGYNIIGNGTLAIVEGDRWLPDNYTSTGIYIYSLWRMGQYLNVHGRIVYDPSGASMNLVVSQSEMSGSACPELNLIYGMKTPRDNYEREFYASYDIGSLWNDESYNGFVVNVDNTNLTTNKFSFTK